jgi:DnaJ-domain-containing protein 1
LGSLSLMLIILISYGIFRVVKDLITHFSHSHSDRAASTQIRCPYCKTKQPIPHDGLRSCQICKKVFEVGGGSVSGLKIPADMALVVEVFAKFTKADGRVTKKEIRLVDQLIKQHFQPSEKQLFKIRELFNVAKSTSAGYEALLHKLQSALPRQSQGHLTFLHSLFQLAQLDGGPHEAQEKIVQFAVRALKVDAQDYAQIKAKYSNDLDLHYRLLNCKKTDSLETIKKNYRQLIKEHHPDRYMSQHVSPDFIVLANQRIQDIHRAYQVITRYRKAN